MKQARRTLKAMRRAQASGFSAIELLIVASLIIALTAISIFILSPQLGLRHFVSRCDAPAAGHALLPVRPDDRLPSDRPPVAVNPLAQRSKATGNESCCLLPLISVPDWDK